MAARSTVFSPSSLRWIANEGYEFKYLFGNTKFASFLPDRIEKKALRFCFLGFGDVRNVLGTIASIPSRSPVKRADFHLVDWHAHNVARGVLFAYLLPRISGEDDLALLWTVMYCTAMPPEMHSQLIEHIDNLLHLLENEPEMYLLHPQRDLSKVCELLAAWKDGLSIPRLQKVLQDRRVVMEKHFAMSRPDVTFDRAVMVLARKFALEIIEDHNLDSSFIGPRAKDQITKELLKYYEYGSVFPYKDDNDAEVSPDLVTNPTFLSPDLDGVWRWSLHYASHPVAGYIPFKKEVSVRLLQRPNKQKKIFKESFKQLQELVTKYRTFYKQNKINLRFSCCEALELIYSGQLERRSYDVVDTSNLADHVGYLNLLIACPSLLVPSPTSRLFTSSMIWQTGTERSHGEYLKTVLGAGPAFYPSLFGVRLIDDIAWGRDQLASMLSTMVGASHNDVDMLRWMPTPESDLQNSYVRLEDEDNKLSISLAQKEKSDYSGRGQTLTMAIRSVAATCFKSLVALTQIEKCTARTRPSSLSMLYFVCNLCERGRIAIPSDVFMDEASPLMPLWQRLADYFAGLLCIPKIWKRQWDAVCYWAFGSGGPTPLGWKGNFTMSSATELALGNGGNIMVFGLIFEASPPPSEQLMMLGTEERAGLMDRCCSVLDVLSFNHRSNTAFILMPPTTRKNSDEKEKVIVFVDPFDSFLISDFIPPSWCTSTNQPGQKSAEVMPEENIVTPQAWLKNVVQRCKLDSLKLSLNEDNQKLFITQSLETEDRYVIKMVTNCPQIQKSASNSSSSCKEDRYELVVEFDGCVNTPSIAVPSALKMEVVYTSLNTKSHTSRKWTDIGRLSLRVPYPVSTYKYDWKRIKTKGEKGDIVQLTLYKCGVWTIDKTMMTPLDISSLDPLGSSQNAVGELNKHLSQMFTVEENKSRCFGMENTKVLPKSAMFDVRETIQILFVNTLQKGNVIHILGKEDGAKVILAVHGIFSVAGSASPSDTSFSWRPLLLVSWNDESLSKKIWKQDSEIFFAAQRFSAFLNTYRKHKYGGAFGQIMSVASNQSELDILRQILHRNALRMKIPDWQKSILPDISWQASYICPAYTDVRMDTSDVNAMTELVNKIPAQPPLRVNDQSSPPLENALSSAKAAKEAGNELFMHKEFLDAVNEYAKGRSVLESYSNDKGHGSFGDQEKELLIALTNNESQSYLSLAENTTSVDEKQHFYKRAHELCTVVLHSLSPIDVKARYRRALANMRLGKLTDAERDLNDLGPAGDGDGAVKKLKQELKELQRAGLSSK